MKSASSSAASERGLSFYAQTLPGLESVLAEEIADGLEALSVEAGKGRVTFGLASHDSSPLKLLACDRVCLLVRQARGDFARARGLAELRGKLARTTFDRALGELPGLGLSAPETFRLRVSVAPSCHFAFFDVTREGVPILEHRLGLTATDDRADVVIHVECLPQDLYVGISLPLPDWASGGRREVPRSLAGAAVRLAGPAPRVAVCDPDCGSRELLRAWRVVTGSGKLLGLTFGRRRGESSPDSPPIAVASPRNWPVADGRLSRILSALPRVRSAVQFATVLGEIDRCLAPGGRAALATPLAAAVGPAIDAQPRLSLMRSVHVSPDGPPLTLIALTRERSARRHRTPLTAGDRARATSKLGGVAARRQSERKRETRSRQAKRRHRKRDSE